MKRRIRPSAVSGTIAAPASKSVAQRAIAAAMLAKGKSTITNVGYSNDCQAAVGIANDLGATVEGDGNKLFISGTEGNASSKLFCGESGLSIRMFTPIAATFSNEITLAGKGSLVSRPMSLLEEPLRMLGAQCNTTNGFLPISVKGPLTGGYATLDGTLGSQILTGLLMAAPMAKHDVTLKVNNLKSRPYIDLTLEVMQTFGVEVKNIDYKEFRIKAGQQYHSIDYNVEGDWSGAAFMLVAGAIAGSVIVENLQPLSHQADRAIIEVLQLVGASITYVNGTIKVSKDRLNSFHFDATDCPDLFPPLVALAAACSGTSEIVGVTRLVHKESDRANALQQEFKKMGITINTRGNSMLIEGGNVQHADVESHNDHRIAMAAAIAALVSNGEVTINGAECVAKSYPNFFEDLEKITLMSEINYLK